MEKIEERPKFVIAYDEEKNKYWRGRIRGNDLFISVPRWSDLPDTEGNPDEIVNFKDFDNILFDSIHEQWGGW